MNQLPVWRGRAPAAEVLHPHLPAHLLADEHRLLETLRQVQSIRRQADGIVGPFGLDAAITLIPIGGAIYSGLTGMRLLGCASRAGCSFGTRLTGMVMVIADMGIGAIVGPGDIIDMLFRSHAIYARMIEGEIRSKLTAIGAMEAAGARQGFLSERDLTRLEDTLHRGGRSAGTIRLRTLILLGLLGWLLYSCAG